MRAVERTTKLFVASVREALPAAHVYVSRSVNSHGRSNYVYIDNTTKVRISDHPIGMTRARFGNEALYVPAGATPDRWAVWLSHLVKRVAPPQTPTPDTSHA